MPACSSSLLAACCLQEDYDEAKVVNKPETALHGCDQAMKLINDACEIGKQFEGPEVSQQQA
jgi:hypothetical protein